MRLLVPLLIACGVPDVPAPNTCAPSCCGAVSGLPRCLNGRPYTCEPLPASCDAQSCGIGGLKGGRVVFGAGACQT